MARDIPRGQPGNAGQFASDTRGKTPPTAGTGVRVADRTTQSTPKPDYAAMARQTVAATWQKTVDVWHAQHDDPTAWVDRYRSVTGDRRSGSEVAVDGNMVATYSIDDVDVMVPGGRYEPRYATKDGYTADVYLRLTPSEFENVYEYPVDISTPYADNERFAIKVTGDRACEPVHLYAEHAADDTSHNGPLVRYCEPAGDYDWDADDIGQHVEDVTDYDFPRGGEDRSWTVVWNADGTPSAIRFSESGLVDQD